MRKHLRLKNYGYNRSGSYFITFCVKDRHEMLGNVVVGCDAYIAPPHIELSEYGHIVLKYIDAINVSYPDVHVDKYIIMPNHVHIIITLKDGAMWATKDGAMWASLPTKTPIPTVIRSLKTLVTKEIGFSLWQTSYHDHIIRDETDYQTKWQYIDENPARWAEDEYYAGR